MNPLTPLVLKPLPYAPSALEPVLSSDQVRTHHEQFGTGYIKRANALLARGGPQGVDALPEDERLRFQFEWNGAVLHELFWASLTPGGAEPTPEFTQRVLGGPAGAAEIRSDLITAGVGIMGSGWAAISVRPREGVFVHAVSSHNYPWGSGCRPLILIDCWEHSYVFDYLAQRRVYLDRLTALIDWRVAEQRLREAGR